MSRAKTAVVIGDGRCAAECARIIAEHDAVRLAAVIHHEANGARWSSDIEKFSERSGVRHVPVANVNDDDSVAVLRELLPDVIFSANNWDVIKADVLALPEDGVINFHNGPLPRYRGVNAPSWAIVNREKQHGVAWHYAREKLDAGDVVASCDFDLAGNETAIELIFRCIDEGLALLPPLLDRYGRGELAPLPQEGKRSYYSAAIPPDHGCLDFNAGFEQLSALVRGLTFHPFPNPIVWPRIRAGGMELPVTGVQKMGPREDEAPWTCGLIREIDEQGLVVCAADSLVRVTVLADVETGAPLDTGAAERYGLAPGAVLAPP